MKESTEMSESKGKKWENWSDDLAAAEATRSRVIVRTWATHQTAQCCQGEFYLLIVFSVYCCNLNLE